MKLNPWYVVGLFDADGSFVANYNKRKGYRYKYQIQAWIYMGQCGQKGYELLCKIRDFFECGRIHKANLLTIQKFGHKQAFTHFYIQSIKDLYKKVIPIFDEYPPIFKSDDYAIWREIVMMLKRQEHLNPIGFKKAIKLIDELRELHNNRNKYLSFKKERKAKHGLENWVIKDGKKGKI